MSVKLHKFLKSDLSHINEMTVSLSNTNGMTISHYACSLIETEVTMPFTIEGVDGYIPQVEVDFCVVIRKKVNLTAIGPNEEIIKDVGRDKGKYKYTDSVPTTPLDLPSGFIELYKNKANKA